MTTTAIIPTTFAATQLFSLGSTPKSIEDWEEIKANMTKEDWEKQDQMAIEMIKELKQEECENRGKTTTIAYEST